MADKKLKSVFKSNSSSSSLIAQNDLKAMIEKLNLFQRKAMNTRMMRDSFKYLEGIINIWNAFGGMKVISKVSWKRNNEKNWQLIESSIFKWLLMMLFHQQEYQQDESVPKQWAQVFYEYLLCEDSLRYNILDPTKVTIYYDVLTMAMEYLLPEVHDAAEEICRFFDHHRVDPYSAVIGQLPSKEILKFSQNISDDTLDISMNYDVTTGMSAVKPGDFKNRYASIISSLVIWSTLPEKDTLMELRRAASTVRGVQNLDVGSLVLVKLAESPISIFLDGIEGMVSEQWAYARVAGHLTKSSKVLLFIEPTEASVISLSYDRVIPVAPEMIRKYFDKQMPVNLGKAVTHLSTFLCEKIDEYCRKKLNIYLNSEGIPNEILELICKNQTRICDQKAVKKLKKILELELPESLVKELETFTNGQKELYLTSQDTAPKWCFFVPSMEKDKEAIEKFNFMDAINEQISEYKKCCSFCIKDIDSQKEEVFNGIRKKKIVASWLRKIADSVDQFLCQHGYESNVLPRNYLDEPPKSIAAVRRNLVLLRRMLKSYYSFEKDPFKLKQMVKNLCDQTYGLIGDFIADIYHCVAEVLELEYEVCKSYSLEEMNDIIQQKNLDDTVMMKVVSIMKDRFHLQDMIRMEHDEHFAKAQQMKIVPISGLIISKMARLENECKSVLDLWEPVRIPKNAEDTRTPLETAVIKGDIKQLEHLLKGNLAYINEQDANGWTALHLSCSFCFNSHRLPVTEFILSNFEEADVTITNNCGNTCVHYLARMPVSEEIQPKYRDVLHLILKNANASYIENTKGETPLHIACLAANATAVRYLLECGSDPNAQAKDGSTPLHYAIQSTNLQCVEILLSYSADYRIENNQNESPLSISIKLNLTEVTERMQEQQWTEKNTQSANRKQNLRKDFIIQKQKSFLSPWRPLTELPATPVKLSLSSETTQPDTPKNAPLVPPRKKPQISDPVTGDWKKAPIPDKLRNAMLSLASTIEKGDSKTQENRVESSESVNDKKEETSSTKSQEIDGRKFCFVIWDIEADEDDELNLKKGDIIEVIKEDESGWWIGSSKGNIGSFPVNYTEIITDIAKAEELKRVYVDSVDLKEDEGHDGGDNNLEPERRATVATIQPTETFKLPQRTLTPPPEVKKTDLTVESNNLVSPTPVKVELRERKLPVINQSKDTDYIPLKTNINRLKQRPQSTNFSRPLPKAGAPPQSRIKRGIVIDDFTAECDEEISLKKSTVVAILKKDSDGWWTIKTQDGKEGIFPGSHLKELPPRGPGRGRVRGTNLKPGL